MLSSLFPSRTLTLYLARLFIVRILGVLAMLVLILQALQLLSESGEILAQPIWESFAVLVKRCEGEQRGQQHRIGHEARDQLRQVKRDIAQQFGLAVAGHRQDFAAFG